MKQDVENTFDQLYDSYKAAIFRYICYLTHDRVESEDLFQETWLRVVKSLDQLDDIKEKKSWIYTIATNIYRDHLRKKRVRLMFLKNLGKSHPVDQYLNRNDQLDPADETEKQETVRDVMQVLGKFPDKLRQVFILKEIEGLTYEEIGMVLDLSCGTTKSRMFRAVKKLRAELGYLKSGSGICTGDVV